jgi:hypothetical protein
MIKDADAILIGNAVISHMPFNNEPDLLHVYKVDKLPVVLREKIDQIIMDVFYAEVAISNSKTQIILLFESEVCSVQFLRNIINDRYEDAYLVSEINSILDLPLQTKYTAILIN